MGRRLPPADLESDCRRARGRLICHMLAPKARPGDSSPALLSTHLSVNEDNGHRDSIPKRGFQPKRHQINSDRHDKHLFVIIFVACAGGQQRPERSLTGDMALINKQPDLTQATPVIR